MSNASYNQTFLFKKTLSININTLYSLALQIYIQLEADVEYFALIIVELYFNIKIGEQRQIFRGLVY